MPGSCSYSGVSYDAQRGKRALIQHANNEGPDQHGRPCSLIWTLFVRRNIQWILVISNSWGQEFFIYDTLLQLFKIIRTELQWTLIISNSKGLEFSVR